MRIGADSARSDAALWHHAAPGLLALGVWTRRSHTQGEDAEPLMVHHTPSGRGVLAVFDGSGGAGGAPTLLPTEGTPRTGAWIAARAVRAGVESWFCECVEEGIPFDVKQLHELLAGLLTGLRPRRPRRVFGTAVRDLPTTMAAIRYGLNGESADCQVLWAGDSRAYAFTPTLGLQPLTRDHTAEPDGLEQLLQDPPLINVICADREFVIEPHDTVLELPVVLLCATDGFFGYVGTPADFECHLLHTLQYARDELEWGELLVRRVEEYTADDASLSIVALGYAGFAELRAGFRGRAEEILAHYWSRRPDHDDEPEALRRWREWAWRDYRHGYEGRMPQLPEERM